jgi:hypothetical protein
MCGTEGRTVRVLAAASVVWIFFFISVIGLHTELPQVECLPEDFDDVKMVGTNDGLFRFYHCIRSEDSYRAVYFATYPARRPDTEEAEEDFMHPEVKSQLLNPPQLDLFPLFEHQADDDDDDDDDNYDEVFEDDPVERWWMSRENKAAVGWENVWDGLDVNNEPDLN